jgi:hypothetical protein
LYAVITLSALALWFLFDRTALGMVVCLIVGMSGWIVFMLIITPYPSGSCIIADDRSGISQEVIDQTGWLPPSLFSATVVFGNIGRKLFKREGYLLRRRRHSIAL